MKKKGAGSRQAQTLLEVASVAGVEFAAAAVAAGLECADDGLRPDARRWHSRGSFSKCVAVLNGRMAPSRRVLAFAMPNTKTSCINVSRRGARAVLKWRLPTASLPLLVVLTCRPSFALPWGLRTHLTSISLQRLSRPQMAMMAERLAGGKRRPSEILAEILARTDGVPLFGEELTKAVLEAGILSEQDNHYALTGALASLRIPTTLQDALMARLDRLDGAKGVAQLGAVLGRQFPYAWLQAVSPLDEATLQQELSRLVEAELLYTRGRPPQATDTFKHALIQETAYRSLLKRTRQHDHQQIARLLVEQFAEMVEIQPELVAHHYTEAGHHDQAIPYFQGDFVLALEHCEQSLVLYDTQVSGAAGGD